MKKKVITFLMAILLVMSSVPLSAEAAESSGTDNLIDIDETNFPDPVFREFLSKEYDMDRDNKINPDEVTVINVDTPVEWWGGFDISEEYGVKYVETLKGIELFPNLRDLTCEGNLLTSLDVSENPKLSHLHCDCNLLTSLDVSENQKLTYLNCFNNKLTNLNVSKNSDLQNLDCGNNQLTSLNVSENLNSHLRYF